MLKVVAQARNVETERLTCQSVAQGDEMVDQKTLEALPTRPRKEMIDDIDRSIAVHATDNDDNVYGVRVLTTANNRSK
eukprot:2298442-Pyramimonas_sp.AAC.1